MLRIAAAGSLATLIALSTAAPSADACSQPQAGWSLHSQEVFRADVPTQGMVLIGAYYFSYEEESAEDAVQYVTIDVFDQFENQIAGTREFSAELGGFLWRSDQPLQAGATYFLTYTVDHLAWSGNPDHHRGIESETISFSTRSAPLPSLTQPTLVELELRETRKGERVCCDVANEHLNRCLSPCGFGGDECQSCWDESYTYLPRLSTVWRHEGTRQELIRATAFRRTADGQREKLGAGLISQNGQAHFSAEFTTVDGSCIQLELERLADGATVMGDWVCGEDLLRIERPEPDFSEVAYCAELPDGYDIDGPIKKEKEPDHKLKTDDGGCACLALSDVAPTGALLGLLPLLIVWRRKRA